MAMPLQRTPSSLPSPFILHDLRHMATWMRDCLDPMIAREGPNVMHPEDVLSLHDLFQDLLKHPLDRDVMAASRIHLAVGEVSGKATRWPYKLIDECDKVRASLMRANPPTKLHQIIAKWEALHGPLRKIRVPLYERGGRLFKVCAIDDLSREDLLQRWTRQSRLLVDETRAYTHWQDEIEPGQWWLNGMFAFRDGIIDSKSADGGICADGELAYAVVLKHDDEVEGSSPYKFTYRCRHNDAGRYRLTAACFKTRYPLRVLRCQTLISLWAPKVGIRYDGLYRVTGWSIKPVEEYGGSHMEYLITFMREPGQTPMEKVLLSPSSEDVDDFLEYRRLRRLKRERTRQQTTGRLLQAPTSIDTGSDWRPVAAGPPRGQQVRADKLAFARPEVNGPNIQLFKDSIISGQTRTVHVSRIGPNSSTPRQLLATPPPISAYDGMSGGSARADYDIAKQEIL